MNAQGVEGEFSEAAAVEAPTQQGSAPGCSINHNALAAPESALSFPLAQVALLEAHAHCAVLAASSADDATGRVVSKAQAPYAALLMDSWLG